MNWRKYIYEFLTIFIAVTISFLVDEWREENQNRKETLNALQLIRSDMQIDTNYYHLRLARLDRHAKALEKGMNGDDQHLDIQSFKELLLGLRGNADYIVQKQGINYLTNNIQLPTFKNDTLLTAISMYYELSSPEGNYGMFVNEHFKIASQHYYETFDFNPHFLHPDTIIANAAIRENMDRFLVDPYWIGRINLMHREAARSMPSVFNKNLEFAEFLLQKIENELDEKVVFYPMKED